MATRKQVTDKRILILLFVLIALATLVLEVPHPRIGLPRVDRGAFEDGQTGVALHGLAEHGIDFSRAYTYITSTKSPCKILEAWGRIHKGAGGGLDILYLCQMPEEKDWLGLFAYWDASKVLHIETGYSAPRSRWNKIIEKGGYIPALILPLP